MDYGLEIVRYIVDSLFGPLKMPWRALALIVVTGTSCYLVLKWMLEIMLLPEYKITTAFRNMGRKPIIGTYSYDVLVESIIRTARVIFVLSMLLAISIVVFWYTIPAEYDNNLTMYAKEYELQWYEIEKLIGLESDTLPRFAFENERNELSEEETVTALREAILMRLESRFGMAPDYIGLYVHKISDIENLMVLLVYSGEDNTIEDFGERCFRMQNM